MIEGRINANENLPNTSKQTAEIMLSDSEPVKGCSLDTKSEIISQLIKITSILYGLRPENLHEDFFPACFKAICERFPLLTAKDIGRIFSSAQIKKKQGTSLTRDELIQPIVGYYNSKLRVIGEIQKLKREEEEFLKRVQEHENEAFRLYLDFLKQDSVEWPFEMAGFALTIAKNHFTNYFKQEEKENLAAEANKVLEENKRKVRSNQERTLRGEQIEEVLILTKSSVYAVLMVREALRRKLPAVIG